MSTHKDEPKFVRNPQEHCYQMDLRLRVDEEIFNRLFIERLKQSPQADLMNPATTDRVREELGHATFWLNRVDGEHVTLKPLPWNTIPLVQAPTHIPLPTPPPTFQEESSVSTTSTPPPPPPARPTWTETQTVLPEKLQHLDKYYPSRSIFEQVYQDLFEQARSVAPSRWFEVFQSAIPDGPKDKEKQGIYNMRSAQKIVLTYLLDEWKDGRYQLTPEADQEQKQEETKQQGQFIERVEAIAGAVNGNKLK